MKKNVTPKRYQKNRKEESTTVKMVAEQTFDFLERQLLQATEVKAALGMSDTSSGEYWCGCWEDSCSPLRDFLGSNCLLVFWCSFARVGLFGSFMGLELVWMLKATKRVTQSFW